MTRASFERLSRMAKGQTEMEKEVDEKVDGFITYLKQKKYSCLMCLINAHPQ